MANIVYIACSIDGYIARQDGSLDWLLSVPNPDNSDYGFTEFMARIDAIVMGRKTFETVIGFSEWPYPKPVFVLSNSYESLPSGLAGKAELLKGDPHALIENLNVKGLYNLYIDGGQTIHRFLKEDLIDELIITRVPVVLGSGRPLFHHGRELQFEHTGTEVFSNGLVMSRYIRRR